MINNSDEQLLRIQTCFPNIMESQPNLDMHMIETIHPYSIDVPEIITRVSREITRNSKLLLKLIELLLKDEASIPNMDYRINRIIIKLQNLFELLETYYKTEKEEYDTINKELKDALVERDAFHIKRKIDEICDEEYSIKLSVADWTVKDLTSKKESLEKNLKTMEDLKGLQLFSDVDLLYKISKDNYYSLDSFMIESYTREKLINTLSKILESVNKSHPSTI